jgi:hypothetical protein
MLVLKSALRPTLKQHRTMPNNMRATKALNLIVSVLPPRYVEGAENQRDQQRAQIEAIRCGKAYTAEIHRAGLWLWLQVRNANC